MSNAICPIPSQASIVKAEFLTSGFFLTTAVTLYVISALKVYSLYIPSYVAGGCGAHLFSLATLTHLLSTKEKPVFRGSLQVRDIVYIPPSQNLKLSIQVHPNSFKSLLSDEVEEPLAKLGNSVYYVEESYAIPENAIGMSVTQKKQLCSDLGVSELPASFHVALAPFDTRYEELSSCELRVDVQPKENSLLTIKKGLITKELHAQLDNQIIKKDQVLSLVIDGVLIELVVVKGAEGYGRIGNNTQILLNLPRHATFVQDVNPTVTDVELEFFAFAAEAETIKLPYKTLKNAITFAKMPSPESGKKSKETVKWSTASHFWKLGESIEIEYKKTKIKLLLSDILHEGKTVLFAQTVNGTAPLKCTLSKTYTSIGVEMLEEKSENTAEGGEEIKSAKFIEIPEDEKGLTVVERLEKRGIAGLPTELNEVIQPIIDMRSDPKKALIYDEFDARPQTAFLFDGPPGTGKSRTAAEIANMVGCSKKEIKFIKGSDVLKKYVGETEQNIDGIFQAPAGSEFFTVVLDEGETLFSDRENHTHDHESSRVAALLLGLDAAKKAKNCLIIVITNKKIKMDNAFLRSGRLGKSIVIGLPDCEGRKAIFGVYLNRIKQHLSDDIDYTKLAELTDKMSGADIEEVVRLAKKRPIACTIENLTKTEMPFEKVKLTMDDLVNAIQSLRNP